MPVPQYLYDDQERILLRVGVKAERLMGGTNDLLWQRLREYLRRLDSAGGRFVTSANSMEVLASIRREMSRFLKEQQVTEFMREVLVDFDQLGTNLRTMHGEGNGIVMPKSLVTDQKRIAVAELTDSLFGSGYDARFAQPVQKALYNAINYGADVVDTERALRVMVRGIEGRAGLMERHVGTVARDSMRQFRGRMNKVVMEEYELPFIRYVGNIIQDSRWQCRRWVEMEYIPVQQLQAEVRRAFRQGSGMIPGTTKDTFIINCGGYNCLHTAFPVREIE